MLAEWSPKLAKNLLVSFAISTSVYVITYILTYTIAYLPIPIFANFNEITSQFSLQGVNWTGGHSNWNLGNVFLSYGIGPTINLVIAGVSLIIFNVYRKQKGLPKWFLLWLGIHGINRFFGGLGLGSLMEHGFYYFISWLMMPSFIKYLIIGISIVAMFAISLLLTLPMLRTSFSNTLTKPKHRIKYLVSAYLLPWLFGFIITNNMFSNCEVGFECYALHETLIQLFILILIVPSLFSQNIVRYTIKLPRDDSVIRWMVFGVGLMILFIILFSLGLHNTFTLN